MSCYVVLSSLRETSNRGSASGLGNTEFSPKNKEAQASSATLIGSAELLLLANAKNKPPRESKYSLAVSVETSKLSSSLKHLMVSSINF